MGAESYYLNLIISPASSSVNENSDNKGLTDISTEQLIDIIKPIKADNIGSYIIDNILLVDILRKEAHPESLLVEGCFSCFEKGLSSSFDLYETLKKNNINVKVFHPGGVNFEPQNKIDFVSEFHKIYGQKYSSFLNEFNISDEDVLPDSAFYKMLFERNAAEDDNARGILDKFRRARYIPIDLLEADPRDDALNPKIGYCEERLSKHIKIIKQTGQIDTTEPVFVKQLDNGMYMVLNGHHRLRAAQIMKLEKLPVKICK